MDTEQAFLRDIAENPDDNGLRLIYADWLEENGRPGYGELIQNEIKGGVERLADPACLPRLSRCELGCNNIDRKTVRKLRKRFGRGRRV